MFDFEPAGFFDLLDLLSLQFSPVTGDEQDAISRMMFSRGGFYVHPYHLELLTRREYTSATAKRAAAAAPEGSTTAFQEALRLSLPLVLSTVERIHKGWGRPTQLTPPRFVEWVNDRLVLAATIKQERFPHNPLWCCPDGRLTHAPRATGRDYQEYGQWIDLICQPLRLGRPLGSRYLSKTKFHAVYPGARAEAAKRRGAHPRDEDIARALDISLSTLRRYLSEYGRPILP